MNRFFRPVLACAFLLFSLLHAHLERIETLKNTESTNDAIGGPASQSASSRLQCAIVPTLLRDKDAHLRISPPDRHSRQARKTPIGHSHKKHSLQKVCESLIGVLTSVYLRLPVN
jgi:hypothetical protein